jgi:F0F1-type ATP synthase membrane subunit b/b'
MDPAKLWYAVSFAVFIGMVYRPLKRFAIPALDRYRDSVRHRMNEARALREEAQKLVAHYSEELRDMEQTYAAMLKKAKEDVVSMRTQMQRQHEQDKKALETAHTMQKNQAVRRMELDFEGYLLSFGFRDPAGGKTPRTLGGLSDFIPKTTASDVEGFVRIGPGQRRGWPKKKKG